MDGALHAGKVGEVFVQHCWPCFFRCGGLFLGESMGDRCDGSISRGFGERRFWGEVFLMLMMDQWGQMMNCNRLAW